VLVNACMNLPRLLAILCMHCGLASCHNKGAAPCAKVRAHLILQVIWVLLQGWSSTRNDVHSASLIATCAYCAMHGGMTQGQAGTGLSTCWHLPLMVPDASRGDSQVLVARMFECAQVLEAQVCVIWWGLVGSRKTMLMEHWT